MPLTWKRLVAILPVALILQSVAGFYIPGVHPQTFHRGDSVALKVNSMTSIHTQVPKDYYHLSFCRPRDGPKMASQNLGEFLTGNKIQSSPYLINMLAEAYCTKLCQVKLSKLEAAKMKLHIKYGYHNNWIIDNLPSAAIVMAPQGWKMKHYAGGFPIGFIESDTQEAYIYNHVKIIIDYHQRDPSVEEYSVVGFTMEPMSVKHEFQGGYEWDGSDSEGWSKPLSTCSTSSHLDRNSIRTFQKVETDESILYTYDVTWVPSDTLWASRWDVYLNEDHLGSTQVHWYSITNSILVVLFLSLLVVSILVQNVKRDLAGYYAVTTLADQENENNLDEPSWKLLHADVFRAPDSYPIMYAVFIGTGVQIFFTTLSVICLSAAGFLSPARQGSLMTAVLVFYTLFGVLAGYVSSRLYKSFRGSEWQLCTILTATLYPGICFCIFLFFNICLFFLHSSGSVPFIVILKLLAMWCFIAIPLVFLGAYFGYKQITIEYPTVTSAVARAIPPHPALCHPYIGMTLAGFLSFGSAFVELYFIMTSMWTGKFYDLFGYTFIVFLILCITCAEVTVLSVYFQLRAEKHRWWWFSFFTSGSASFYTFVYTICRFQYLDASKMLITYLLYFGYTFLFCFTMFLVTGTVGALTSLWFVRKIFATNKDERVKLLMLVQKLIALK